MAPEPKILRADDLPSEIYHAMPRLSFSQLKILCDDHAPVDFWYKSWMNPNRPGDDEETTRAMAIGRAMHCMLLEPEVFRVTYQLDHKHKGTSKPFFVGAAPGGDYDMMQAIRDSIMSHPLARQILSGCRPEVSMLCDLEIEDLQATDRDKLFRFPVRCRHDIYKETYSADLKFVESVSDSAIANMFARYRYHQQAEWYLRIMRVCNNNPHQNFAFIFCEKKPPYKVRVVQVREGPMALAREHNDYAFKLFAQYMHKFSGLPAGQPWPGYGNVIYNLVMDGEGGMDCISLPSWLK